MRLRVLWRQGPLCLFSLWSQCLNQTLAQDRCSVKGSWVKEGMGHRHSLQDRSCLNTEFQVPIRRSLFFKLLNKSGVNFFSTTEFFTSKFWQLHPNLKWYHLEGVELPFVQIFFSPTAAQAFESTDEAELEYSIPAMGAEAASLPEPLFTSCNVWIILYEDIVTTHWNTICNCLAKCSIHSKLFITEGY